MPVRPRQEGRSPGGEPRCEVESRPEGGELLLERRLYGRRSTGELIDPAFVSLHYPCFWRYTILHALVGMAEQGLATDPRCSDALDLLESKRLPDGGFPAERLSWRRARSRDSRASGLTTVDWGPTSSGSPIQINELVTAEALTALRSAGQGLSQGGSCMSDGLALALLVAASTVIWPLNRWALRHGATPVGIGIVLSAFALAGGVVGALATRQPVYDPAAFFYGALGGIAYAVGFSIFILRCLGTGPVAPTVAAHGLGVAGAVLASLFVPYASSLSTTVVGGFAATLVTIGILGLAPMLQPAAEGRRNREWSMSVVAGWAFMAVASATQFLSGWFAPSSPFGYIVAQKLVSLLILLLLASSRGGARLCAADLVAGGGTGVLAAALLPLSITAMAAMGGLVEYPISVAGPAALVLVGAVALFRERLSVWGWIGCLSGLAAMVLLSLPRAG